MRDQITLAFFVCQIPQIHTNQTINTIGEFRIDIKG